jgi:putative phosphoesterase
MNGIRIGVLSDTHIPGRAKKLPEAVLEGFRGVDAIIHAGDVNREDVIAELEEIAPVYAVAGNTDDASIWKKLGRKKVVTVGKCRIGVVHGDGTSGTTLERAAGTFSGENVNCVVFGHSHVPLNQKIHGVLYFNPGSPTDKRRQERFSYGILTIRENVVTGEIRYFL